MILLLDEHFWSREFFGGRSMSWNVIGKPTYGNHLRKLRCPPATGWPTTLNIETKNWDFREIAASLFSRKYICVFSGKNSDMRRLGFFFQSSFCLRTWFHREPQFDSIQVSRLVLLHSPPSCAPPPKGFVCAMATCYLWRIWNPNGSHGTLKRKSNQLKEKGSFFLAKKKGSHPKNWWIVFLLENWMVPLCWGGICCSSWLVRVEIWFTTFCTTPWFSGFFVG